MKKEAYSLEELRKIADAYFDKYGVQKVYATSDGQVFLNHGRAKLHAGDKKVYEIEAEEVETAPADEKKKSLTVAEIQDKLPGVKDVEEARQMLLDETGGLNRSTATKAIEKHIEHLLSDPRG